MNTTKTDRIEKEIFLKAPRSRVWRALTDSKEFGAWFQCEFNDPFRVGAWIQGKITFLGYEHLKIDVLVESLYPERIFSLRWHPMAIEPGVDYSKEPTTLVEFTLKEVEGGTLLRVVESGFDAIPVARRAAALDGNNEGWKIQMTAIETYLRQNP